MSVSRVHIAGVGIAFPSKEDLTNDAIEAGARALLDAGITYAKVQLSVACSLDQAQARIPRECFKAFGRQKAPVCSMDSHSALHMVAQCIRTGQADCAMLVGLDKGAADRSGDSTKVRPHSDPRAAKRLVVDKTVDAFQIATIAVVLVSDQVFISHAFLKDSAVHVKACTLAAAEKSLRSSVDTTLRQAGIEAGNVQLIEAQGPTSTADKNELLRSINTNEAPRPLELLKNFGATGLASLCGIGDYPRDMDIEEDAADLFRIVWRIRGWTPGQTTKLQNCFQHTSTREGQAVTVVLCRSDGQPVPKYQDVIHLRDGRERLGYNPAEEAIKEIGWRMEGVKSREGDRAPITGAEELQLARRNGDRAALARL